MKYPLHYPKLRDSTLSIKKHNEYFNLKAIALKELQDFANLKFEYGADKSQLQSLLNQVDDTINRITLEIKKLPEDTSITKKEPDDLKTIRESRPEGQRILWKKFYDDKYAERLMGSLHARMAGCTLGAPVEAWSIAEMRDWAHYIGDTFPPVDYWRCVKDPSFIRYGVSECFKYTKSGIDGVPADDDIVYTLLGLLIMEDYGPSFTTEDVGAAWVKYLPHACGAEMIALQGLKNGLSAYKTAEHNNPYIQYIGADIRSDPWGYLAPGYPEKAASYAYRDAYLSHRRNGVYGAMFFSAVISAAFETDNAIDALKTGLSEIPKECMLSNDIKWALEAAMDISNYSDAAAAVKDRFGSMNGWHTNLNACLTIFGLIIGGDDISKVIGETVAMGYDNDCTAATAGSIAGAIAGMAKIPEHWHESFNNKIFTYINSNPIFFIDNVIERFLRQAKLAFHA